MKLKLIYDKCIFEIDTISFVPDVGDTIIYFGYHFSVAAISKVMETVWLQTQ